MEAFYSFFALGRLTGNVDLRGGYNHYFYHRSSDNRWVAMPWDLDMMFIPKTHHMTMGYSAAIDAYKSILENPALALEYRNRCRELLNLLVHCFYANGGRRSWSETAVRAEEFQPTIDTPLNAAQR